MSERLFDVEPVFQSWQRSGVPLTDPATNTLGAVHELAGDTERAAAALVAPRTGTLRARVLEVIADCDEMGATLYDIQQRLHSELLYSIAPRLTELRDAGWIRDSERRRITPSGALAIVWALSERGRAERGGGA